ncbi:MAG: ABC transporter ATP-binding protein, partial [Oscillospiraceae bacterium]|nr:ABC transporter ATP-binding protein [Oscillospiraceae bacterium]
MATKNGYRQLRTARPGNLKETVKILFKYMRNYRLRLFVVVVAVVTSALTRVASNYFFKPIINDYVAPYVGMENVDLSGFIRMLGFMALIYALGIVSTYAFRKMMSFISTGVLSSLRNELFDHLQDQPMMFYDTVAHGRIMSYFTTDVDTMRQLIAETFPQVISTTVMVTGITTMMFTLDWRLSVIALAMLGLICLMTYYLSSHGRGYFKTMHADISNLIGYTEETFAGQKVVKAFMHEPQTRKEFREYVEAVYESNRKTNAYSNMLMPINGNLSYMSYALIACIGAVFCIRGSLDIGTLASFLLYTRQLSQPISRLSQEFNYVMMALAGAERVFQLLDSPSEVDEGKVTMVFATENEDGTLTETDHRTGVWAWKDPRNGNALTRVRGDVRFNDVHFSYVPDKKVLGGISFYAKPGQKIAFVGSTGAGKTTITNLITRFYDVQQGTITYDGFNVQDIAKDSLRASIGMVLQH